MGIDTSWRVTLQGGAHGHTIIAKISLSPFVPGLYWFEISFDGELKQRLPVEITQRQPTTPQTVQNPMQIQGGSGGPS